MELLAVDFKVYVDYVQVADATVCSSHEVQLEIPSLSRHSVAEKMRLVFWRPIQIHSPRLLVVVGRFLGGRMRTMGSLLNHRGFHHAGSEVCHALRNT